MAFADITADGISFSFHSLRFVVKLYKDFSLDSGDSEEFGKEV